MIRFKHLAATFIFIVFAAPALFCQTSFLDSLKQNISRRSSPTAKLQATLDFCNEWESFNADTLFKYAQQAKQLAFQQKNDDAKTQADYFMAVYLFQKNQIDTALKAIDAVLRHAQSDTAYSKANSKFWLLKGNILMRTANYSLVLQQDFNLLAQAEKIQDTLGMIHFCTGIGNVNLRLKKLDESLKWHYRAIALMTSDELRAQCSFVFINLAVAYYHLSELNDSKQTEDSIEMNLEKAIRYARMGGSLTNLANSLGAYGNTLAAYNKIKPAQAALAEAVSIRKSIGDVFYTMADMLSLSSLYQHDKNYAKATAVCLQALDMLKANGNDFLSRSTIYSSLGEIYSVQGDYKKCNEVLREEIALQDSIYKSNTATAVTEMQTKYEVQKKENTIILQKLDIAAKKNSIYAVSILTGILLIGILLLYRYYYKKQQQQKQNEIIAIASAEEAERRRISADLHDNIGAYAAAAASTISTIGLKDPGSREDLLLLNGNVQDMITQLNDSIWALNRKSVQMTAISDRFKLFIRKLEHAYPQVKISVHENITNDRILSPFQALHLFRIMQEALNNALRHSQCNKIDISLNSSQSLLYIQIQDNGIGMKAASSKGNGIHNLKQRAKESGWDLEWIGIEEGGTAVVIRSSKN